ncbi:hypothetical protein ACBI99_36915 [Nonomuraea sp. ATR24]|uniref:golvesin C-terminal-like domain-containing protein n=1 Tax=Nonomuraea sp. ATR24 TaxID=1676744 RepID=UPI0035C0C0FC
MAEGWQQSPDTALATSGDETGFHVLTARAKDGYQWKTVATLAEPGMDTDQWIGNACLTGDGASILAVYAPRHFTNRATLFARGAFAAVINAKTGEVVKLEEQVSLAYFNPGCGADSRSVLSQSAVEEHPTTRLLLLDTKTKKLSRASVLQGQITSAVPHGDEVVAADGNALVAFSARGKRRTLALATSTPFDIQVDADGGIAYAEHQGGEVTVKYLGKGAGAPRTLAKGALGRLSVKRGVAGKLFLVGDAAAPASGLPQTMEFVQGPATGQISSHGELLVRSASRRGLRPAPAGDPKDTGIQGARAERLSAEEVDIAVVVPASRQAVTFEVLPDALVAPRLADGSKPNQSLLKALGRKAPSSQPTTAAADPTEDVNATCSVPRNDPTIQVYQPHWRQVEWAVDQLVMKRLTLTRPDDWKGSGLSAWSPQALFTPEDLRGGGRVPTNIMLGILAQESNLWQSSSHVMEGETGNPLIGNYYGISVYDDNPANDWDIDFANADCGYGISQQTDGMRKTGAVVWPATTQKAVAVDYVTNIAAGLQTLTEKWNQIWDDTNGTMLANNGAPSKLENWYFAVWAYNSGWHPKSASNTNGGAWGLGWTNNPSSGLWRPGRRPFLDRNSYTDAATPQHWPYQEKVLGWAAWPIMKTYFDTATQKWTEQAGYNPAWWNTEAQRSAIVPTTNPSMTDAYVDVSAFCSPDNSCTPSSSIELRGTCQRADFKCWWHSPKVWKTDCPAQCGNEGEIRYSDPIYAYTERVAPTDYWRTCLTSGLPSGSLVVDDVLPAVEPVIGSCAGVSTGSKGKLEFTFGRDAGGKIPAKIDFHQLGNGYGGHEWFAFTRRSNQNGSVMRVTGTWTLNQALNGWARVLVHVPERRAQTQQAPYTVNLGNGASQTRYLPQLAGKNEWRSLGVFQFAGTPSVSLTTLNQEGDGTTAIAWDAIAFQPLAARPKHFVVAMGDSYSSGEGIGNYENATDVSYKTMRWNACRRSKDSWIRKAVLPGETRTIGQMADSLDPNMDFHFVACSGARTHSMTKSDVQHQTTGLGWSDYRDKAEGRFREIAQLDAGYLDENTTLATVSIGGNDAGFPSMVTNCWVVACNTQEIEANKKADISGAVSAFVCDLDKDGVFETPCNVKDVLEKIDLKVKNYLPARAKKAKVVLMGYPRVFDGDPNHEGNQCSTMSQFSWWEVEMLNRLADHMAAEQSTLAAALKASGKEVSYANPIAQFGAHGACDDDQWVIPVSFARTGEGDFGDVFDGCLTDGLRCASRTSVHPNNKGAVAYAQVLQGHLASTPVNYTGW